MPERLRCSRLYGQNEPADNELKRCLSLRETADATRRASEPSADNNGAWPDTYFVCSTGCPGSGETDALQYWTYNGVPLPSPNGVVYKCGSITVNGN